MLLFLLPLLHGLRLIEAAVFREQPFSSAGRRVGRARRDRCRYRCSRGGWGRSSSVHTGRGRPGLGRAVEATVAGHGSGSGRAGIGPGRAGAARSRVRRSGAATAAVRASVERPVHAAVHTPTAAAGTWGGAAVGARGAVRAARGADLAHVGVGAGLHSGAAHWRVGGGTHTIVRTTHAAVVRALQEVVARHRVVARPHSGVLVIGGALKDHPLVQAGGVAEVEPRGGGHRRVARGDIVSIRSRHTGQIQVLAAL